MNRQIHDAMRFFGVLVLVAPAMAVTGQEVLDTQLGGKIVLLDDFDKETLYEEWHFAPARVEGGMVFVSGVVIGAGGSGSLDEKSFQAASERVFSGLVEVEVVALVSE